MTIPISPRRRANPGRDTAICLCLMVLAAPSASGGPPFRTDDPETVDFRHYEITLFSQEAKTNQGWLGVLPSLEVNYGALPNLQLHVIVPVGYVAPSGGHIGIALGDIELGAKYRFIVPDENDWFPQVGVFPAIEVPVGNQPLGFSTGHAQVFLPIWLQKDFDPWTVYGGGGYWINPGAGNRNYTFAGVALWRKITDQLRLGLEVFHQTSPADGVKEGTGFNAGLTYDFSADWHLLASAGSGLTNRAETNQFSYYLGLQLTF
jgi:hypothetical protein